MTKALSTALLISNLLFQPSVNGFQQRKISLKLSSTSLFSSVDDGENNVDRRSFLSSIGIMSTAAAMSPTTANAGIDVSGLRVEGGSNGNPALASQLKAYDGSGSGRVSQIKSMQGETATSTVAKFDSTIDETETMKVAHWAYRANPNFKPSLARSGPFNYRYNDQFLPPAGSSKRFVNIEFQFPNDWLQLDKQTGGVQYVDQRNGDKLYVLAATLEGDLENAKKEIGDLIFDPNSSFTKTGQTIEDYKVVSAQTLSQCPDKGCTTRRRFKIKYATVTGNGLRVERRALVDAYQVEQEIYMLMTSSNAVNFEKKDSRERETVENIVSSFVVE